MGDRHERRLRLAGLVFIGGFLLHNADHGRRGIDAVTDHVVWAGTTVAVIAAVALTLVFTRHPMAPLVAAAAGLGIAFGVTASHLLPEWSAFSDPLPQGDVDGLTWVAVLSEIAGALLLAAAGISALRLQRPPARRRSAAAAG
jgi:hypothetical protein